MEKREPRDAASIRTLYRVAGLPMTAENWETMLDRVLHIIETKYGPNHRLLALTEKARADMEYTQPIMDWLRTLPDSDAQVLTFDKTNRGEQ